jgi:hypothetical protein
MGTADSDASKQLKKQNITYCMEQSPSWEANRFSVSQEIRSILWDR